MQWIQLILALSLLVVIHELGHFFFARLFKVRVEKFYMFFNPKFSLVRAKKINGKWQVKFFAPNVDAPIAPVLDAVGNEKKDEKGNPIYRPMTDDELRALPEDDWRRYPDNTEWGIGWVPFGGYCASPQLDYHFFDVTYDQMGYPTFQLQLPDGSREAFTLRVPGIHNVSNALAAIALSDLLGIPHETVKKALLTFQGTERRFEYKGICQGFTIIDDYAHHPTEITATLTAAANYPHHRIWCVFQPHTYTRTKAFLPEFAQALTLADEIVLTDIYAARETDTLGISSRDLQAAIQQLGKDCHYFSDFQDIENFLLENCSQNDLLITMGAGDVVKLGEKLVSQ